MLFLFLFAFAIKNTELVNVRFFLGAVWHAPLVIVMLVFFVAGAVLAVLAMLATFFRLRRQLVELKAGLPESQANALPGGQAEPLP
ncbi:MAG TPA: LapA family protein [Accumulibacter sp.]|nr:LapA family protein [Accumulibacter sp.]